MGLFASARERSQQAPGEDRNAVPSVAPAGARGGALRRLLRIAGPLLLTLAIFAALEGGLRLYGFEAHIGGGGDPLLNPQQLFRTVTGPTGVALVQRHDAPVVTFLRDKPANGYRVFVVGDSTAFGFPFGPEFSFSRFLQERLAAAMPERTVEVVNCAMNGMASWHARKVVDEIVRFQPDVIFVHVGHGDWITPGPESVNPIVRAASQLRFYQLAVVAAQRWQRWRHGPLDVERLGSRAEPYGQARDRARGTQTLGTREREWITARFADDLRTMIDAGRAVGATVILDGLAQNVSDFPPGASRHRRGITAEERARWRAAIEQADAHIRAQEWAAALSALDAARGIDGEPAILHYLRGRCLQALGRYDEAQTEYQLASDTDAAPLGAPSEFDRTIADVARESGVQFVDLRTALMRSSPHGLVGNALFFDYVHPTIAGHEAIAAVLADALGARGDVEQLDPAALFAARPELDRQIYAANVLLYLALGWYDQAIAELNRGGEQHPEMLGFREIVERFRARETVPAWDDFPEAAP